jgi:uncharacterized protein involved in exopolysaccharide biosynthesis
MADGIPDSIKGGTQIGGLSETRRRWTLRDIAVYGFYRIRLLRNCVVAGLLVGMLGAYFARTYYTADALMIVLLGSESAAVQNSLDLTNTQISVDGLKAVQGEIQIIQTDDVLRAAIERIGVEQLYPRLSQGRLFGLLPPYDPADRIIAAVERFQADLRAEAQGSSNAIRIAYTHDNRELAIKAVQAVTDAYLARRSAIYVDHNSTVVTDEIGRYSARLRQFETAILAVKRKSDVLDMAQDIVLATNRLDGIAQRNNQVRERRVAVQTEIIAVRANLAAQPATVLDFRETTNNTGNDEARNTLVRLMQERAHLLEQYKSVWPGLKELDQKIATVRQQMSGSGQALYFAERTIRNPAVEVLNNRLAALEVEEQALGQQLVELAEQSRIAEERIAVLREAETQLHSLQLNRDVAEGIYRQLSLRQPRAVFNEDVVADQNSNIRLAQPPTAPLRGRNLALSYLVGGGFLGLLMGMAGIAVATALQHSYIVPSEAEADLGLANLGEVSIDGAGTGKLRGADAIQGAGIVAANLLGMTNDGRPLSLIQIVATETGGLQANFTRALAEEFARTFAMRTLILDLTEPNGAAVEGPPPDLPKPGTPEAELPIPVARTDVDGLWVSVNAVPVLLRELQFVSASDWHVPVKLRQHFPVVLMIGPSDLSSAWMRRLSGLVDASVLIIRAESARPAVVVRYRDAILKAGGDLAGFVFVGRRFYIPRWLYRRL